MNLLCWLVLGLAALAPCGLHAQALPEFEVDAVSMRADVTSRQTRLDIYTRIPFTNLRFINTVNGFTATYEVAAQVYRLDDEDRRQSLVQSPIWENAAVVDAFALTQSPQRYDHTTHSLELNPGRYLIEFQVTDLNSRETFVRELPVSVRSLSRPVALSDIILLDDFDAATQTIYPLVGNNIGSDQYTFEVFYEIYSDRRQPVRISREVVPIRKQDSALIRAGKKLLGLGEAELPDTVVYADAEEVTLERGRHQTVSTISFTEPQVGEYLIRIRLEDRYGRLLDDVEKTFSAEWTGLATHLVDIDEAINQLQYIAKSKELRAIREASSPTERLRRFEEFWQKRDPTPNTRRNERMEEYYYRIDFANRRYSSVTPGWKTDRGHVLIRFGEPDDIRRQTFSFNNDPWEIWYYYRIGRQFIFIDKTGFGDFELLVPIWDERTRIR